jgi:sulfur carrier protein ThiS
MFMKIFNERSGEEKNLDFKGNCEELLKKLEINPEEVLIIKNGELVSLEELCEDNDEIKLLSVVSGG